MHCNGCPIKNQCDVFSPQCQLTPGEVVKFGKIKLRTQPHGLRVANLLRSGRAKLGMKKYDRRRKVDTPQRMLWRHYKLREATV